MNMEEKERIAEDKFKEWLNKNEIPFWYIYQNLLHFLSFSKERMPKDQIL